MKNFIGRVPASVCWFLGLYAASLAAYAAVVEVAKFALGRLFGAAAGH